MRTTRSDADTAINLMAAENQRLQFRIEELGNQSNQLTAANRQLEQELEKLKDKVKLSDFCMNKAVDNCKRLTLSLDKAKEALEKCSLACSTFPVAISADELKDNLVAFAEETIEPAIAAIAQAREGKR